jgi:XTP/dITP diphosphohydrolase
MRRLVLASTNPGKLREFRQMLDCLGIEIVAQGELGIAEAAEPHATFVANALAKARHASRCAGMPALADDSGICVTALAVRRACTPRVLPARPLARMSGAMFRTSAITAD